MGSGVSSSVSSFRYPKILAGEGTKSIKVHPGRIDGNISKPKSIRSSRNKVRSSREKPAEKSSIISLASWRGSLAELSASSGSSRNVGDSSLCSSRSSNLPSDRFDVDSTDLFVDWNSKTKWKSSINIIQAREKFSGDKSIPEDANDSMLEMRLFLAEAQLFKNFLEFSLDFPLHKLCFIAWIDIHFFKSLEEDALDYRICTALVILEKYCTAESHCFINIRGVGSDVYAEVEQVIINSRDQRTPLSVGIFDELQLYCFLEIYYNVWLTFRSDVKYTTAVRSLNRYNQVDVDDFQYMETLGAGGFGFVVHGKKISTGKHYAIKVQKKLGLLQSYSDCAYRVTFERQAMAKCNHPFIVGLDYAFQTDSLVLMAMELGSCKCIHITAYTPLYTCTTQ